MRRDHVPAIVHVTELTQPQGHSTSGSHERYKSKERLAWERRTTACAGCASGCSPQGIAGEPSSRRSRHEAARGRARGAAPAWDAFQAPILERGARASSRSPRRSPEPAAPRAEIDADLAALGRRRPDAAPGRAGRGARGADRDAPASRDSGAPRARSHWCAANEAETEERYGSHLYAKGAGSALAVAPVAPPGRGRLAERQRLRGAATPASTRRSRATRTWSPSARTSASSATSTRASPACRRSTASCASPTPGSARRRSWGRRSAWRCAACGRSPRSSTSTTSSTACRLSPTTSPRCAGGRAAARRRRSSSARAATGSRGSGTPARRWPA